MAVYPDSFRNALTASHTMTCRAELYQLDVLKGSVALISGSVSADRSATVRRTLTAALDPLMSPATINDLLTPYGTYIKVYRGIRFPDVVQEYPVFYGRIDTVETTQGSCNIRASDRGADIADARFEKPYNTTPGRKMTDTMKDLIIDVIPGAVVNFATTATNTVQSAVWDRERVEALDSLATSLGCEWFAGPDGQFYVQPLPAITQASLPSWTIDAGSSGVLISSSARMERQNIYNSVVVNGEPPDKPPVYSVAHDTNPASPLRWGGPFGKVPRFYASQFIYTQAQADNTANSLLQSELSGTRYCNVSCVPNPAVMLSDVVSVVGAGAAYDGIYFISSFDLPLGPDEAMQLAVYTALPAVGGFATTSLPAGHAYDEVRVGTG